MRRFIVLPMAFILCIILVTPAFAFTSDSFVIDSNTYLFNRIQANRYSLVDKPSIYSVSDASSSKDSVLSISLLDGSPVLSVVPGGTLVGTFDSGLYEGQPYTTQVSLTFSNFSFNGVRNLACYANYTVPTKSNVTWDSCFYPTTFDLSYDVSSLNSSSLEFSGVFAPFVQISNNTKHTNVTSSSYSLKIFIDGSLQREYRSASRELDLGGWIYNGSSPVSNVKFELNFDTINISVSSSDKLQFAVALHNHTSAVISGLSDDGVLDGFNDQAQNDINRHESYEADYTSSMNSAFNALSLDSFTWHDGLISAFSLISGIFTDLWNGMGIYAVLYTFPLFLAIVLLLIGRISKYAGTKSSGKNGDD